MSSYITSTLLVILILNPLTLIAQKQTEAWHVYSSAEDRFTVAVPRSVRISKFDEKNAEPDQKDSLASYISVYEDAAGPYETGKFRILVINTKAKDFASLSRGDLLTYLSVMIIGDDDDPRPSREMPIKVNGLTGREYVWAKESKTFEYGSSGELFKRGRTFDRGDKIYIIVFVGENAAELKSQTAERFLNSFRLSPRRP
jgi:hypothetical protein